MWKSSSWRHDDMPNGFFLVYVIGHIAFVRSIIYHIKYYIVSV